MTPTDQTPDAVRAAIADVLRNSATPKHPSYAARAIYDRLAQIGALRPVGEGVTISVEAVTHIGHFMRDARHFDPEFDQWVLDELDAAARAGDGAT